MIAGIGGLGAAAPMGVSGLGVNGGLNGPLGDVGAANLTGAATLRLQQLSQLIEGFTSAEILLALMIAAASKKDDKEDNGCGALALLAGMALASHLGGLQGLEGIAPVQGGGLGGLGGQLNVTA